LFRGDGHLFAGFARADWRGSSSSVSRDATQQKVLDHSSVRSGPPAGAAGAAGKAKNDQFKDKAYTFSRVFAEEASQEDLYVTTALPLVEVRQADTALHALHAGGDPPPPNGAGSGAYGRSTLSGLGSPERFRVCFGEECRGARAFLSWTCFDRLISTRPRLTLSLVWAGVLGCALLSSAWGLTMTTLQSLLAGRNGLLFTCVIFSSVAGR